MTLVLMALALASLEAKADTSLSKMDTTIHHKPDTGTVHSIRAGVEIQTRTLTTDMAVFQRHPWYYLWFEPKIFWAPTGSVFALEPPDSTGRSVAYFAPDPVDPIGDSEWVYPHRRRMVQEGWEYWVAKGDLESLIKYSIKSPGRVRRDKRKPSEPSSGCESMHQRFTDFRAREAFRKTEMVSLQVRRNLELRDARNTLAVLQKDPTKQGTTELKAQQDSVTHLQADSIARWKQDSLENKDLEQQSAADSVAVSACLLADEGVQGAKYYPNFAAASIIKSFRKNDDELLNLMLNIAILGPSTDPPGSHTPWFLDPIVPGVFQDPRNRVGLYGFMSLDFAMTSDTQNVIQEIPYMYSRVGLGWQPKEKLGYVGGALRLNKDTAMFGAVIGTTVVGGPLRSSFFDWGLYVADVTKFGEIFTRGYLGSDFAIHVESIPGMSMLRLRGSVLVPIRNTRSVTSRLVVEVPLGGIVSWGDSRSDTKPPVGVSHGEDPRPSESENILAKRAPSSSATENSTTK
jgi:hypothetical protein